MIKKKQASILFLFSVLIMLSCSASAHAENLNASLFGLNWTSESNPVVIKKDTLIEFDVWNKKNSSENMIFRIYTKENPLPVRTISLAPGSGQRGKINADQTATYYITLDCDNSRKIFYLIPPCWGWAKLTT